MISLTITVETAPGLADKFIGFLTAEAACALAHEPGCRRFEISRCLDQPNLFALFEVYDDMTALEAHRQTPHYLLFQEQAREHRLIAAKTVIVGELLEF